MGSGYGEETGLAMNTKKKGSKNERRSMALFEAAGYTCLKAGASLGVFDIVGIGSKDFILCQVKSNRWPAAAEMETLKLFTAPENARKLVHRWDDRKRVPQVREV
jgi:Holliday junction resolvase